MSVFFAYDGSIHSDWTARYAIRLAAASPSNSLHVLYVEDTAVATPILDSKFNNLRALCDQSKVDAEFEVLPMLNGVFGGLTARIPETPETMLVCGTRAQSGRRGFLSGTISHQLLNHRRFSVAAFRIVQPGHLGVARRVLLPISGSRHGVRPALPLLRLLHKDAKAIRLLRVMMVTSGKFRRLGASAAGALRREGELFLESLSLQLTEEIDNMTECIDFGVRVSDDWVKEIVIDAGRNNTDLICLEAPKSSLSGAFRWGDPVEKILRDSPSDVVVYRGPIENAGKG